MLSTNFLHLLEICLSFCVVTGTNSVLFEKACSNGKSTDAIWWQHRPYVFRDEVDKSVKGISVDVFNMAVKSCCKIGTKIVYKKVQPADSVKESVIKGNVEFIVQLLK